MFRSGVNATVKLDGTNIGVYLQEDPPPNRLAGRRMEILASEKTYQNVPLQSPRGLDTRQLLATMRLALAIPPESVVVCYGELLCNIGRYGYEEKYRPGEWKAFGFTIQMKDCTWDAMCVLAERLCIDGWDAIVSRRPDNDEDVDCFLYVCANGKLVDLLKKCSFPVVDLCHSTICCTPQAGLVNLVKLNHERLKRCDDEGLVVSIAYTHGGHLCSKLAKWKCAAENQGNVLKRLAHARAQLTKLVEEDIMCPFESGQLCEMIQTMIETASVTPPHKGSKGVKAPKVKVPTNNNDVLPQLEAVFASAQSKYELISVSLAKGVPYQELIRIFVNEMKADLNDPEAKKRLGQFVRSKVEAQVNVHRESS